MNRLILVFLLIPTIAFAAGVMKRDKNGVTFPSIAPTSVTFAKTSSSSTAGTQQAVFSVTPYSRVRIQPPAAVTMKVNGTGTAWPIAQGAVHDVNVPSSTSILAFYNASSVTGVTVVLQVEE